MGPVQLDSIASIPPDLMLRLRTVDDVFWANEYVDSVVEHPRVRPLATELEEHLRQLPVRGYHCTREPVPGYFAREGLRLTDVEAHQREFLNLFSDRFTLSELQDMRAAWKGYFAGTGQTERRNGRIWFCLTKATAESEGARVFFQHFGGEAIFMPLKRHPTVAAKLGAIGSPVIVEARLAPHVLSEHTRLALPLLSAYHLTRKPDALAWAAENYIKQPLDARDVLSVTLAYGPTNTPGMP